MQGIRPVGEPEWSSLKMLYTLEECGSLLSLSRSQLYRLVEQGDLESVKIGKSRRVTRAQLERFVFMLEETAGLKMIR